MLKLERQEETEGDEDDDTDVLVSASFVCNEDLVIQASTSSSMCAVGELKTIPASSGKLLNIKIFGSEFFFYFRLQLCSLHSELL